ncbi:MAG: YafY family transcriptional regulator [Rhodoferax sp.]|uniref:helix-turn-helix transcriptional regulator n=1 Tax=Rhodoferax sp. TaxID=50421 RepID=UPI001B79FDC8|nr:YafY family protein [Rhodoferax sp.]MBP8286037.1 YafY family transcriptional regulator [Rhodoferax sp.]MBP9147868.1 YafY family transcriptional regulator [Rhodoferax sp.]MBP9736706.1 YafY family transcriptional regulator [Rhodoferax sp.]
MDRTERFYKINEMLRANKVVSFATLATSLEVSRSTLKRDLKYLCERLHNPIAYRRDLGGYQLVAPDAADKHPHELPGLWLSPTEIHALLTMQQLLAGLDAGGVLTSHITPLIERLNALLGPQSNPEATQLRQRVRIIQLAQRSVRPRHFEQVATALAQRKRIHIAYTARGNGSTTERDISPQRLVHYRDNWYLDAWCHQRQSLRNFALDAIARLEPLNEPAREVSAAQLSTTFGPGYGIFSGGAVRWARLHFSPERARWVAQEQWHPEQSGKFERDGSYLLRLPYTDHRELIMDILKHGTHCEVLGPPSLRKVVGDEVKKLGEKYF